jgi:hypothetical protein
MGLVQPLQAEVIYSNATNDLGQRFVLANNLQVGDQIILDGTARYMTLFRFEYWGANSLSPLSGLFDGDVQARVRFYLNNGAEYHGYLSPGTNFFDSGWFSMNVAGLGTTERSTIIFQSGTDWGAGGLYIPANEMTWSVEFGGLSSFDSVGLDIYSPPTVGQNYPDYWESTVAGWVLRTNVVAMDFAALITAQVPEPSAVVLWIAGGVALLAFANRTRRWK